MIQALNSAANRTTHRGGRPTRTCSFLYSEGPRLKHYSTFATAKALRITEASREANDEKKRTKEK